MNSERLARLCVSCCPGFGSRSLRRVKQTFMSWQTAWTAPPKAWSKTGIPENVVMRFCEWRKKFDLEALLDILRRDTINVVFPEDDAYPRPFRTCSDAPEILFVRGKLTDRPAISVVGTRSVTSYGRRCVDEIVGELARQGLAIVSGLALGVDAAAHQAALNVGGTTIAILGTGIEEESLYPRNNVPLAHAILEGGGAILSEFPLGADARKEHFPIRNRLIASMSLATLVIEAAVDSGSLITAKLAIEENREVLAVPGPIWSQQSNGTNQLLKLGAKVCTCANDVLEAIQMDRPEMVAAARATLPVDPKEQMILDFLDEPRHIDDIGRLEGMDPVAASSMIAVLELKGLVKPIGGQMWVRSTPPPLTPPSHSSSPNPSSLRRGI